MVRDKEKSSEEKRSSRLYTMCVYLCLDDRVHVPGVPGVMGVLWLSLTVTSAVSSVSVRGDR